MPNHLPSSGRRLALSAAFLMLSIGATLAQGTREQQEACAPDAVRLCAATIPDVAKTTACMRSHVAELGPRCRAVFAAATGGAAPVAAARPTAAPAKPASRRAAIVQPRRDARVLGDARRSAPNAVTRAAARDERRPIRAAGMPARRMPDAPRPEDTFAPVVAEPSPPVVRSRVPGLDGVAASIAESCRQGLIDPFTCRTTFDTLQITQ